MQCLTDGRGMPLEDDSRRKLSQGEHAGKYDSATGEYRKYYDGQYWISANGVVYMPLTSTQAAKRGTQTFD
jgi:hypothetical protein